MKRTLFAILFLLACVAGVSAQEAEFSSSGGTAGAITAAPGSGTAGRIPQFASATSVVDSKMTTSGTNSGTWTLYDSTVGSGISQLVIREGAGQIGNALLKMGDLSNANYGVALYSTAGTNNLHFTTSGGSQALDLFGHGLRVENAPFGNVLGYYFENGARLASGGAFEWTDSATNAFNGTVDIGMVRSAAGILKVTDGSTGSGGIGISDAATATVSDALILRHATTDAGFGQDGFGTGLLFQAENDVGTMHDAASIDAVFTDSGDASEDSRLDFNAMVGGASANLAAMSFTNGADFSVYAVNTDASNYRRLLLATNIISGGSAGVLLQGVGSGQNDGNLYLGTLTGSGAISFVHSGSTRWNITDAFFPAIDNTYDIGTSALKVKDSYLGTSIQGTRTKTLTDNTITDVVQISSTAGANANGVTAGHVSYTIIASDATTDLVQTEVGQLPFLLVNENGTVTVTLGTVYGTAIDSAGGAALANTFASSVTGTNAMIRVTSNYDQATLTGTVTHDIRYRVYIDSGTATVTPQ